MHSSVPSLLFVPLLVTAVPLAAQQSYTLTGDRVAVYNLAGRVTLAGGSGSAVVVTATPGGAEGARLRFEQGEARGRNALRVIYPSDEIAYRGMERGSSTNLRVNEDGTFDSGDWGKKGRRVSISGDRGTEAHADLAIAVPAGRTVEVYLAVGTLTASNVRGNLRLDASSADVKVSSHRGALEVDNGAGNVEISQSEGPLSIDTGSGNVRLTDVVVPDELAADAGSGNITGTGVRARALSLDTGSGNIELSAVQATDVSADAGSGDVRIDLASDPGEVEIDTGSGDVELRLPATAGAQVEVETGSGDIRTDFALQVSRTGDEALEGRLGDGRGRLEIETGSGDVSLLKR